MVYKIVIALRVKIVFCSFVVIKSDCICSSEWQLFNRIRGQDIKLLKTFSVTCIVDLMVEKKKVKFGMK